ncbi:MAG: hypothetical protein Tsb009_34730 [Planctomycetaceae bacterium]
MEKPKVYLETTVISYLTAWRSPQLMMAAHQEATRIWWDEERHHFDIFVSEAVIQEAALGDEDAARRRMEAMEGLPQLNISDESLKLANLLVQKMAMPETARMDALHIAIATVNGMDFLLTWNCRHIANATLRGLIASTCKSVGYEIPVICTPIELIEDQNNER